MYEVKYIISKIVCVSVNGTDFLNDLSYDIKKN